MSGYLQKKQAERQSWIETGERISRQYDVDTWQIALARYDKLNLGYQRIMEITELAEQVRKEYGGALSKGPEQDVQQDHIDQELKQIMGDREGFIPFERRYPELKRIKYGK